MSLFKIILPVPFKEIAAALPPQHHINSRTLDGDNIVIVYDDPSRKTGFTFPVEEKYEDVMRAGEERARQSIAAHRAAELETERLQAEAEERQINEDQRAAKVLAESEQAAEPVVSDSTEKAVDKPRRRRQS